MKIALGGIRVGSKPHKGPIGDGVALTSAAYPTSAPKPPAPKKPRRGRPFADEAHLTNERRKPWVKAGISRRSWYRQKAQKEAKRGGR